MAALRHHDSETNLALARLASEFAGSGVVGFDLAGDESLYQDLAPYEDAFACARAAGLGLTCHAAEAGPGSAAKDAVQRLGVARIGHGIHLAEDPAATQWIAEHGVVVEICPTSNLFTGAIASLDQHSGKRLMAAGISLVLGDDNPIQTGSDLPSERTVLKEQLGWTDEELQRLDQVSIDAAFAEPSVRARLRATSSRIA